MINAFRNYSLLLVVFIHAHIYLIEYSHINVPSWLVFIYFDFLGYFHPASVLAAISGYLFYKDFSGDQKKWDTFLKEKYFKRIKSILFPYLFWLALFFVVNNLLIYVTSQFKAGVFVNQFQSISPVNFVKAFFYPEMAVAKHLWYLNNLLFVFIAAPIMPFFSRNKALFVLLLLAIMAYYWTAFSGNTSQTQLVIKYRFIMFFLVGAFFGLNKAYLSFFVTRKRLLSLVCILLMAVMFIANFYTHSFAMLYVVNSLVVPVLVFYVAYVIIAKYVSDKDLMYNRSNHFLLYIIHPFLLTLFCKVLFYAGLLNFDNYVLALLVILSLSFLVVKVNTFIYHFLHTYFKSFTLKFL